MRNAPARKGQGVECQLAGDVHAHSTTTARVQFLARANIPRARAFLLAGLVFGEARHG